MDAGDTRRKRLKQWIDDQFEGRVAAFCRYYGLPDTTRSYLSQLLSKHRTFGERAARKIERECGKPEGWLDVGLILTEKPLPLNVDMGMVARLPSEARARIEDFIRFTIDSCAKSKKTVFHSHVVHSPTEEVRRKLISSSITKPRARGTRIETRRKRIKAA